MIKKGGLFLSNGNNGNDRRNRLLDFLSFLLYLGRGVWVRRNPETKEDEFITSKDLGVQNPDKQEEDGNGNGNSRD
ncbi:MAG: hypothetical protein KME64_37265 [Scytonematopsis contorta HA4267-MV1]|nr:hypothetical protein [Scytonematopsis contorta HA4267-MV1]